MQLHSHIAQGSLLCALLHSVTCSVYLAKHSSWLSIYIWAKVACIIMLFFCMWNPNDIDLTCHYGYCHALMQFYQWDLILSLGTTVWWCYDCPWFIHSEHIDDDNVDLTKDDCIKSLIALMYVSWPQWCD